MPDATLSQGNRLLELVLREDDSRRFLQTLLENWGEVQRMGRGKSQTRGNPYASERVEPKLFYPDGYQPNSVVEQVRIFCEYLGDLDTRYVQEIAQSWKPVSPGQMDGLYVVPRPSIVSARLSIDPWNQFGILTEQGPLAALEVQRSFTNFRKGGLGPDCHRLRQSTRVALEQLESRQQGDFLVFPAQTGRLYVGRSVRNALWIIEHARLAEWPLPAYCVGWMLFANQHRLEKTEHMIIDCPGDEYQFAAGFKDSLCFWSHEGQLRFVSYWVDPVSGFCGSASALLR